MDDARRLTWFGIGAVCVLAGCAVPQRQGNGKVLYVTESTVGGAYYLYLPEDYIRNDGQNPSGSRWPLVMTFHGLRPYDDAGPQIREWQEEADRYGFIVCAPVLRTCDTTVMVPPLNTAERPSVRRDEALILAAMDDVCRRTQADPTRVLSTSFSSGGYFAHYMVNRHPERFSCLAVRQSNFSEEMMQVTQVPKYREMPIGIFFGENDFKLCRDESREAVTWYRQHHFEVTAKSVVGLGHQRTPQTASVFFAEAIGATPKSPPPLGSLVMYDVMPTPRTASRLPGDLGGPRTARSGAVSRSGTNAIFPEPRPAGVAARPLVDEGARTTVRSTATPTEVSRPRTAANDVTTAGPIARQYQPVPRPERRTPTRTIPPRSNTPVRQESAKIHLNATVGVAPLWLTYSIELPDDVRRGASILWMDNGRPIGTAMAGSCVLKEVGEHKLEALIITAKDEEIRVSETVTVLPKLTATRPSGKGG